MTFVSRKRSTAGSPRYATDDDNAIFSGMYLAAASYRYAVTQTPADLIAAESALEGVYLLTHVSGTPGVVARWVFPLENAWDWIGYDRIKSVEAENGWSRLIAKGQLYEHGDYAFYTRTAKTRTAKDDQGPAERNRLWARRCAQRHRPTVGANPGRPSSNTCTSTPPITTGASPEPSSGISTP